LKRNLKGGDIFDAKLDSFLPLGGPRAVKSIPCKWAILHF
jgi:hypothetical protein